ncbi:WD40/YVTN/BNR-like repeat-containing protein [Lutispora sp.]|uniref:WD40/YVTN/BNR-like repeat-containing protein n=1 Tax=Lutispora sp. TaxID=2828727 RepID=UPI002B1F0E05|nr:hypothetical protein [Lutispora sp.]
MREISPFQLTFQEEKYYEKRFINILNMGKKRNGIVALIVVFLLVSTAGIPVACQSADGGSALKPGTIYSHNSGGEQVIAHDAGNSYSLDKEGHVIISYNKGETTVKVPLTLYPGGSNYESGMTVDETGFYISEEKTAIAYGGFGEKPVQVLISEGMGKSWNTYTVTKETRGSTKYIGFVTKNDGWLVLSNFHGMGSEDHYIYKTADGGKTWTEVVGNANDVYTRVLTGAGFANDDIGFLSFRYDTDFQPAILVTQDGGLSWTVLNIKLPENFDTYSKTPLSPVFEGANGLFPILLSKDGASNVIGTIYLTSDNYGKTWVYNKAFDSLKSGN